MDIPIRFPSDEEVIVEETAHFRRLTPEGRLRTIRGMLTAGALMMRRSPKSASLLNSTLEQENLARQAVQEFIARHGG